jgi:hypothetical protein
MADIADRGCISVLGKGRDNKREIIQIEVKK